MNEFPKEIPLQHEGEQKFHAIFSLMNFRGGHWPGTKTPPWLLNEMWEAKNQELKKVVSEKNWSENKEILIGSGTIEDAGEMLEVDVYALRDSRKGPDYYCFAAYPKGKSNSDFWDEDGQEKDQEDTE